MTSVQSFEIEYNLINRLPAIGLSEADCYYWDVLQKFDYQYRSLIKLSLTFQKWPCEQHASLNWRRYPWVMYLVIIFAGISLFLQIKYLLAIRQRYNHLRNYYVQENE